MSAIAQEMQLQIKPVTGALGAEVWGIDIANLDDSGVDRVNELILEYGALSLHGQEHISTEQLREFGLRFGKLDVHGYARTAGGFDDVMKIGRLNESWHSDLTWKQLPAKDKYVVKAAPFEPLSSLITCINKTCLGLITS